ncbi:hypothetical protein AKJ09_09200 [Labilithrix luteola]|uniref:Uncharacterized protein n=1 Tax=Labilithrix luteola TaxID=1391654 RepID=A0A0K1QA39_9BACT|nr:hypothetical protein [Labilithrix luteola]AKV02537.1 hypothetical protein AKJ09_09200 [Labilithrix luteola]
MSRASPRSDRVAERATPLEEIDPNDVVRDRSALEGTTESGVVAVPALPNTTGTAMPRAIPTPLKAFPALLEASLRAELAERPDAPSDLRKAAAPLATPTPMLALPDVVLTVKSEVHAPERRRGNDRTVPTKPRPASRFSRLVGHVLLAIGGTMLGAALVLAYALATGMLHLP